jgi:hypothetical protein
MLRDLGGRLDRLRARPEEKLKPHRQDENRGGGQRGPDMDRPARAAFLLERPGQDPFLLGLPEAGIRLRNGRDFLKERLELSDPVPRRPAGSAAGEVSVRRPELGFRERPVAVRMQPRAHVLAIHPFLLRAAA